MAIIRSAPNDSRATEPLCAARLRAVIGASEPLLAALSDSETARRPAPAKWSPREVIGHLIDSASNNHQRFVRAASQEDLVSPGYEQDRWVELQDYQNAPWRDLVSLWAAFNRHIARVMAAIPESVRSRPRARHNLHEIAWRPVPATEPTTLDYFMMDYVRHLEHHLRQVLGSEWDERMLPQTARGEERERQTRRGT
ncbi:MAG: DinB family protein [Gemmatimonadaceae bacterium]